MKNLKDGLKEELSANTIYEAYKTLLKNGTEKAIVAYENTENSDKKVGTTLRMNPRLFSFYKTLSDTLGVSLQETITMTLEGSILTMIERRKNPNNENLTKPDATG